MPLLNTPPCLWPRHFLKGVEPWTAVQQSGAEGFDNCVDG